MRLTWAMLPFLVLAIWYWWPTTEATRPADITAQQPSNVPVSPLPTQAKPHRLYPDSNSTPEEAEKSSELASLRSSLCWNSCGAPCASISESGEPVCSSPCAVDDDCARGERCLATATTALDVHRAPRCQRSHCETDEDCGPERSCIPIQHRTTINVCSRAGSRQAGEPCFGDEYDPIGLCDKGLMCGNGTCFEVRDCEGDGDCALGTRCGPVGDRTSCVPGCIDDSDCSSGTECLALEPGAQTLCLERERFGCTFDGCEAPFECVSYNDSNAARVTACQRPCASQSDCSESEVCGAQRNLGKSTHCYPRCNQPSDCLEGWLCTRNTITENGEDVTACYRDTVGELRKLVESLESPDQINSESHD